MNSRNKNDFCQFCVQSSQDGNHIWCIDCGDEVKINEKDTMTCRCENCKRNYRNNYMQKFMANKRYSS